MPIPVITVAQMREWEKATWAAGQSEETVMRQAGQAVAQVAERLTKSGDEVLVLAGKGHNGGDAIFAAEVLHRRHHILRAREPGADLKELKALLAQRPALVIDGLFGIGLDRPLSSEWIVFIGELNHANLPVLAVDVPSGLNADTGEPMPDAVRASATITIGAVKAGLLKTSAWPFVGRLEVAPNIGLIPCPLASELNFTVAADFALFPRQRAQAGHKGTFGHVAIIAGSPGYHGAAVLASRGAQRAQPGLITLYTAPETYTPIAAQCQAVMVRPWKDGIQLPENCTAVLAGPGLASPDVPERLKNYIADLWVNASIPLIIDASALPWLKKARADRNLRVITPHPGEAARLLGSTAAEVQKDRGAALRQLSHYGNCFVVLKGHQTLVGQSEGPLFVNSSGNPFLGQGGTGDLLAGYLAGLLAQPSLQTDPLQTIRFAVWQHGAAADVLSSQRPNWIVEDLAEALGTAQIIH